MRVRTEESGFAVVVAIMVIGIMLSLGLAAYAYVRGADEPVGAGAGSRVRVQPRRGRARRDGHAPRDPLADVGEPVPVVVHAGVELEHLSEPDGCDRRIHRRGRSDGLLGHDLVVDDGGARQQHSLDDLLQRQRHEHPRPAGVRRERRRGSSGSARRESCAGCKRTIVALVTDAADQDQLPAERDHGGLLPDDQQRQEGDRQHRGQPGRGSGHARGALQRAGADVPEHAASTTARRRARSPRTPSRTATRAATRSPHPTST